MKKAALLILGVALGAACATTKVSSEWTAIERSPKPQRILVQAFAASPEDVQLDHSHPIIEINLSGEIQYLNPVTQKFFPDLKKKGFDHPFLKGLKNLIPDLKEKMTQIL